MRIRLAVPDALDDQEREQVLNAALEATTRSAEGLVRRGMAPIAAPTIQAGRVKWRPEPPGDEHFDMPNLVVSRGWGDCDDLAPWHAASLRVTGRDPEARAFVRKSGEQRWHALVRRGNGTTEDPSLYAGMRGASVAGVAGVVGALAPFGRPLASDGSLALCICPTRDPRHPRIWFARCDLPSSDRSMTWTATSTHPHGAMALVDALQTVRDVAEGDADEADGYRLAALHDLVMGVGCEEVAAALEELEPELDVDLVVGEAMASVGFFDDIVRTVSKPFRAAANAVSPFFAGLPIPGAGFVQALAKGDPMGMLTSVPGIIPGMSAVPGGGIPAVLHAREFFERNPLGPTALPFAQTALPTLFPGFGSLFMAAANPTGPIRSSSSSPARMPSGSALASLLPEWSSEPGSVQQPYGQAGPAFMRF